MSDVEVTKEFLDLQKRATRLGLAIGIDGVNLCIFNEKGIRPPIYTCSFFKEAACFLRAIELYAESEPKGFTKCVCLVGDDKLDASFMQKADLVIRIKDNLVSVLKSRDGKLPQGDYVGRD